MMMLLAGIRRGPILRPAGLEILILRGPKISIFRSPRTGNIDFRVLGIGNIEF